MILLKRGKFFRQTFLKKRSKDALKSVFLKHNLNTVTLFYRGRLIEPNKAIGCVVESFLFLELHQGDELIKFKILLDISSVDMYTG